MTIMNILKLRDEQCGWSFANKSSTQGDSFRGSSSGLTLGRRYLSESGINEFEHRIFSISGDELLTLTTENEK